MSERTDEPLKISFIADQRISGTFIILNKCEWVVEQTNDIIILKKVE